MGSDKPRLEHRLLVIDAAPQGIDPLLITGNHREKEASFQEMAALGKAR
jgi:hypothetical protein